MAQLWASEEPETWQEALDGYGRALEDVEANGAKNKDRLVERDRWYQQALPKVLEQRGDDPYISQQELEALVNWKVRRGKWRGPLVGYARQADDGQVQAASRAAFAALRSGGGGAGKEPGEDAVKAALDAMCVIYGVGPATASAILQAYDPSVPYTSDQAMLAALGSKDYKVTNVLQLTSALRGKAAQLSKASGRQWSAKEVEQALYAAAVGAAPAGGGTGGGGKGGGKGGGGGGVASGDKKRKRASAKK